MKSRIFFCLTTFLYIYTVSGQSKDKNEYSRALSYFATGNSFNSVGNFAALSTANTTLSASFFFLDENKGIYTVDVKAGATQGVFTLFDEGELNSNVSIGFSYRLIFGKEYVGYDISARRNLERQKQLAEEEYLLKKVDLLNSIDEPKLTTNDSLELKVFIDGTDRIFDAGHTIDIGLNKDNLKKLKKISDLYLKINNDLTNNRGLAETLKSPEDDNQYIEAEKIRTKLKLKRDELIEKIKANEANDIERNRKKKAMYNNQNKALISSMNTKKNTAKKNISELKPLAVHLNFLSFGYRANNNRFVRFIDSLDVANQLTKTNYTSHNFNVSYNFISNIRDFQGNNFNVATYKYLSIGANFTYSDNQSSLEQVEVSDTRFESDDGTRSVIKTQNAFIGNYIEDLAGVTAFIDYYSFFNKNPNFAALHINPSIDFKENQKPIANMQLGLLIPFLKKKDQKSVVNVEVFYRFKDVFNNMDANNTLLNRNIIGLQTSFPFNF